jgi:RNA polymerase sigma factor (sigma-70 family)
MSVIGSVTHWIHQLQAGDRNAAQPLWERYFRQLVKLARGRLEGLPRPVADEEDVALSTLDSFCRGIERGRFPQLHDRTDLWQLLVVITERKAIDLVRKQRRLKRGGGKVVGQGAEAETDSSEGTAINRAPGREPSPAFAAQVAEEFQRLLASLEDPELVALALWKMEGHTNEEIAAKLGCVRRTVDRRLRLIRRCWEKEIDA